MSVRSHIEPSVLRWARKTAGYSSADAAKSAGVDPGRYDGWERGEGGPTVTQLRRLANAFKRPLNLFFLPEPLPEERPQLRDFRRPEGALPLSPKTQIAIRRATERREVYIELLQMLGISAPTFEARWSQADDIEDVSQRIRALVGLSVDEQVSWKTDYDALRSWRAALERLGILVFQESIPTSELRGLSLYLQPLPIVMVSSADAPLGRVFSLVHEFCHLGLRETGICDQSFRNPSAVEVFCNAVAGETLVPKKNLLDDVGSRRGEWSEEDILSLSRRYSVSRFVILRRLVAVGRASEAQYGRKHREWLEQVKDQSSGGPVPPYRKRLSELGRPFVSTVLSNYYAENINLSDVSQFLGLKTRHLTQLEKELE